MDRIPNDIANKSEGFILHPHCPFEFCKTGEELIFGIQNIDFQCSGNKFGFLCGAYLQKFCLTLGKPSCEKCSNAYISILIALGAVGICLILCLLVFRLHMAHGTLSGFIFYTNVAIANRAVFPSYTGIGLLLSWSNLELGVETCFYSGLDRFTKVWLQFLFPIYILLLVGLMVHIRNYPPWMSRWIFGTNPVVVLATLIYLSYNNIMQSVIMALHYTHLHFLGENSSNYVWLCDGNVPYLTGKHASLFTFALLVLVFFITPYTLLLVFGQWMQARSNWKVFSWITYPKMKIFMDSYHAPYKQEHRYWPGLLLVARGVVLLAVAMNGSNDPCLDMLVTGIVVTLTLMWMMSVGGVYKKIYLNVLEAAYLFNFQIFIFTTYLNYSRSLVTLQATIGCISVGIAFFIFFGSAVYHIFLSVVMRTAVDSALVEELRANLKKIFTFLKGTSEEESEALIAIDASPTYRTTTVPLQQTSLQ